MINIPFINEVGKHSYELIIDGAIEALNPPASFGLSPIRPAEYFITSGDAIQKTRYLCKVLWHYAGSARRALHNIPNPTDEDIKFEKSCWKQAGSATRLLHILIRLKGDNVFLETEWSHERKLICNIKNPRAKGNADANDKPEGPGE